MNTSASFSAGKLITIIIAVIVAVGGGAFYGGLKYAENTRQNPARQNLGGPAIGANAGGFRNRTNGQPGGGFVSGEIITKDDKSITVKLRDGGSKIIFFSDSTKIIKSVSGTPNDLGAGESVILKGKTNQDGSITAESMQLRSNLQQ